MKALYILALIVLTAFSVSGYALADVAGVGTIIVFGLLPYALIAAIVIVAAVLIVKAIRRRQRK